MKKRMKKLTALLLGAVLGFGSVIPVKAAAEENKANKYNVVFVVDESGSMRTTDKNQFRYDSLDLFLGLMSQQGNYAGSVSFDDKILHSENLAAVEGSEGKSALSAVIRENTAKEGDTDIGGALEQAVNMLNSDADPDLPSAIILLTDGNTDLDNDPTVTTKEEEESLEKKAEAIEQARAKGYPVYSVCLNENGAADFSETQQISTATRGQAQEVKSASDLEKVLQMFYQMIYGTSPLIVNGEFDVPEVGVEEANIMIEGEITGVTLTGPDGQVFDGAEETKAGTVTLEKIVNPTPGHWKIDVDGDDQAKIRTSLLFNYNFYVKDVSEFADTYNNGDTVTIRAELADSRDTAMPVENTNDYTAEVRFVDEKDQVTETIPMDVKNGGFETDYTIEQSDHAYRYYVAVSKTGAEEDGDLVKKSEIRQFVSGSNTAPVSNGDVSETIKLWPFKKNVYELDLTTLAKDAEDSTLQYTVLSSAFLDKAENENGDYTIEGDRLVQDHFSLRKGSYVIRCTDSGGLYCDVNVTISSINIGLLAALGMIGAVLIGAGVALYGLYVALNKRFNGDVYLRVGYDGEEIKRSKNRGRIKLNVFNVPITGIRTDKSYFQALGGNGVELVADKEIYHGGRPAKRITIPSGGTGTEIKLDPDGREIIYVRFASRIGGGRRSGGRKASRTRTAGRSTKQTTRSTRSTRSTR